MGELMKISYNQITLWSLVKIGLLNNIGGWLILSLLLMLIEAFGIPLFGLLEPGDSLGLGLLSALTVGLLWGLFSTLLFLAGALASRLLGDRGPSLDIRTDADRIARRFE
jgi:hypothetical protein